MISLVHAADLLLIVREPIIVSGDRRVARSLVARHLVPHIISAVFPVGSDFSDCATRWPD
jgi:hypothetical protein